MARRLRPPRIARRLLEQAVPEALARDGLLGDLHELYVQRRRKRGRLRADLWYWREACSAALSYRIAARAGGGIPKGAALRFDGRERWMRDMWRQIGVEARQSVRRLLRSPGFTAAATLPLAIGLGAAATIFTLVHDVVLAPLPYPEPDRLVVIRTTLPGYEVDGRVPQTGVFMGQYLHYRERSALAAELGGYWTFDGTLTGDEAAEYLTLGGATAGLWRALGVRPADGRLIREDDPWPGEGGQGATLLSHGFWTTHYGNTSVVGRTLRTGGMPYHVVGVLPASLPLAPARPAMWNAIPDALARANPQWTMPALVARLRPGATAEALERELAALTTELPERYPDNATIRNTVDRGRMTPEIVSLRDWVLGGIGRSVWLLFASVLLLLVVALANVAGLSLVRADNARRELAVRLALGSGRRGLALRMVLESVVLVGVAAALALALARIAVAALARTVPVDVPGMDVVAVGGAEVGFVVGLAFVCGTVLALVQLFHGWRSLVRGLHDGGRGAAAGSTRLRLRHAFVSVQIGLALILSIGAGLIVRSAWSLAHTQPGFPVQGLLTFRVPFPFGEVQAANAIGTTATPFYDELTRRLAALPGVEAAGWGSCAPLSRLCDSAGFAVRRPEDQEGSEAPAVSAVQVSPGFRSALGIRLIEGRDLTADDQRDRSNRVLVSASLAGRLWPGQSPLERTFTPVAFGQAAQPTPFTVAGVVADVRFDNLRRDAGSLVYLPVLTADQASDVTLATFVLRTSLPPLSLLAAVRRTVAEIRPDIPVAFAETMEESVAHETASIRFSSLLVLLAAGVTLLLSVLGVYGVLAYVVGLRRPEFGIRLAMGASGAQLHRMVLAQGMVTAGVGVVLGLVGAAGASRLVRSLLFGVAPVDPATYALAAAILLIAAAGATVAPARRAARVPPADALRGS
jgi:putative ABC transport system permease protein